MEFTPEMLEKAKTAKTAEELLEMAKADNVELTAEEAAKYFADLHKTGELSDEELDNVAAGCSDIKTSPSGAARNPSEVQYLYWVGKYVEVIYDEYDMKPYGTLDCKGITHAADIKDRKAELCDGYYYPKYKVKYRDSKNEKWVWQNLIDY